MLFPLVAFVVLLIIGLFKQELSWGQVGLFILIAVGGLFGLHFFGVHFAAYAAVLGFFDVVLILMIFKGDISLR